ncbi:MAG: hypothetical protein JNM85_00445 [Chthonomonas sp.]|nr:hypothetical protein [Chthonomonas sp.]
MKDFELMHSLADGQLEGEERNAALAKMSADPRLEAEYQQALALKSTLKRCVKGEMCNETWSLCKSRLDEIDRASNAQHFVSKYSWQMAACLFFLLVGAGIMNRVGSQNTLHTSDVASYAAGLNTSSIVPESVRSWFSDRLGNHEAKTPLELVGFVEQRMQDGRIVQVYDIRDERGQMRLLRVSGAVAVDGTWRDPRTNSRRGVIGSNNCLFWTEDNAAFLLLGNRSHDELQRVVDEL